MTNPPTFGVVIATHRRPAVLKQAIESWEGSHLRPDQLVIIDSSPNASETRAAILKDHPSLFKLKDSEYIVTCKPSANEKKNLGLDHLWTDLASFADDDTIVSPSYSSRINEVFARDSDNLVGGVGGTNSVSLWEKLRPRYRDRLLWPLKRLMAQIYVTRRQAYPPDVQCPHVLMNELPVTRRYHLWGACMTYRTDLARSLRFDESMRKYCYQDDWDFSFRVGRTHVLLLRHDAEVVHLENQEGRIIPAELFLLRWLNSAYVIEKLLPQEKNRAPLRRYLMWARFRSRWGDRTFSDSGFEIAAKMLQILEDARPEDLKMIYSEIQDYVFSGSPDLMETSHFSEWIHSKKWFQSGTRA